MPTDFFNRALENEKDFNEYMHSNGRSYVNQEGVNTPTRAQVERNIGAEKPVGYTPGFTINRSTQTIRARISNAYKDLFYIGSIPYTLTGTASSDGLSPFDSSRWLEVQNPHAGIYSLFDEYDPTKHYRPGAITNAGNEYYECYHPNGCLGVDPTDAKNRPSGWTNTDPSQPYHWIKIGKFLSLPEIGVPQPFPTINLREGVIKYNGEANLHKDKFWRLAHLYPDLVSGNFITIADLRAKYIQGLDDGRGVDVGRTLLSHQGDTMREIEGTFAVANVVQNDKSTGVFGNGGEDSYYTQGSPVAISANSNATSNEVVRLKASRVVPTGPRFTGEDLAMLMATRI